MDESYRVRLPQRDSSQLPEQGEKPVSPASTRVVSPGIESMRSLDGTEKEAESPWTEQADKEVYHEPPPPPFTESKDAKHDPPGLHPAERPQRLNRKKWILVGALAAGLCIAIALGVGLGVGLTRNKGCSTLQCVAAYCADSCFKVEQRRIKPRRRKGRFFFYWRIQWLWHRARFSVLRKRRLRQHCPLFSASQWTDPLGTA